MGEIRDADRSRAKIVAAAVAEFAENGFAGARVEAIGRRAGVNKQLLYHYFGGKDELFRAVLDRQVEQNTRRQGSVPADPARFPEYYFDRLREDDAWLRFLTWEAAGGGEVPGEDARRRSIAGFVEELRAKQTAGLVPSDVDPRYLLLAVYALTTYPLVFSQITRLTTGSAPTDPEFQREWRSILRRVGNLLLSDAPRAGPGGDAPSREPV